jgi:predicted dehydrogenase
MADQVRLGVAGLTHGHVWGLIRAAELAEGVELVAVADRTPLLDEARAKFSKSYASWQEMLDAEDLDLLIVTSDNVESSEITVQALGKGIPCIVEKAMAANAKDADRMLAAQKSSGRALMINWPLIWNAWLPELKKQIDAGTIGHTFHFKYRNGHCGPKEIGCDEYFVGWLHDEAKNGGGAIADFGSYGAAVARWYFGMPETVYCVRHNTTKDYDVSDDHALIVLKYPKLDVLLEATWATKAWDDGPNPVAYGKEGTLAVYGSELKCHRADGVTVLEVPDLPTKNPITYFLECIRSGKTPEGIGDPNIAADAARILDAAIKSSASGKAEIP